MEEYVLLKDQRISLKFSHAQPGQLVLLSEPLDGQYWYAKADVSVERNPLQIFLGASAMGKKSGNLCIYFLCPSPQYMCHVDIRVLGPLLDQLLAQNKGLKLKVTAHFDQFTSNSAIVCNDMAAAYDGQGKCCFKSTVQGQQTHEFCHHHNVSGKLTIEVTGLQSTVLPDPKEMTKKLLEDQRFTDFELVADNGSKTPCLKAFLAAASTVFDRMLSTECQETKEGACKLHISEEGVKALLDFIYCSNVDLPMERSKVALELLVTGHKYDISALEAAMKTIFLSKPVGWLSIDVALLLFIQAGKLENYEDVKMKAVQVIKSKKKELKQAEVFDQLIRNDPEMTKELMAIAL